MGKVKKVMPVKLFCGFIYKDEDIVDKAIKVLKEKWGEIDLEAGPFPFDFTDYYEEEMGENLKKRFISFEALLTPDESYEWKLFTNSIEENFSEGGKRKVNIDPGYIDMAKVVLFSTKNFYHRIYLGKGIFAEVTLYYTKGKYEFFPWTYPDYKTKEYTDFFLKLREVYSSQIEKMRGDGYEH
jgi:hypothetical protein